MFQSLFSLPPCVLSTALSSSSFLSLPLNFSIPFFFSFSFSLPLSISQPLSSSFLLLLLSQSLCGVKSSLLLTLSVLFLLCVHFSNLILCTCYLWIFPCPLILNVVQPHIHIHLNIRKECCSVTRPHPS